MGLNVSSGNMYADVTHTWNAIKGECPHRCQYCYMKRFGKQKPPRLDERELKTNLGYGNVIFVGSSIDIFADGIPKEWIVETLNHCEKFPGNKYYLQTKNPKRFKEFSLPIEKYLLGTTIETNRYEILEKISNTPSPYERATNLSCVPNTKFLTIEPIIDFDLFGLLELIEIIKPKWVNIGKNTGKYKLKEPCKTKTMFLINALDALIPHSTFLEKINLKTNLLGFGISVEKLYFRHFKK